MALVPARVGVPGFTAFQSPFTHETADPFAAVVIVDVAVPVVPFVDAVAGVAASWQAAPSHCSTCIEWRVYAFGLTPVATETVIADPPDVTTPVQMAMKLKLAVVLTTRCVHVIPPPVAVGVASVYDASSVTALTTMMSFVAGVNDGVVKAWFSVTDVTE